jgi:predicted Zn-dependent peptidase
VKENPLFSEITAHLMGSFDPGLFVISGRLNEGVDHKLADEAIESVLQKLSSEVLPEKEVQKVKNKAESTHVFGEMGIMNKAMNLAFGELLEDASMVNKEIEKIQSVTAEEINMAAKEILRPTNCTTLYYLKKV